MLRHLQTEERHRLCRCLDRKRTGPLPPRMATHAHRAEGIGDSCGPLQRSSPPARVSLTADRRRKTRKHHDGFPTLADSRTQPRERTDRTADDRLPRRNRTLRLPAGGHRTEASLRPQALPTSRRTGTRPDPAQPFLSAPVRAPSRRRAYHAIHPRNRKLAAMHLSGNSPRTRRLHLS